MYANQSNFYHSLPFLNSLLLCRHNLLVLPDLLLDVFRLHLFRHHWLGLLLSNIQSSVPLFFALLFFAL